MGAINLNQFYKSIENGVESLAKSTLQDYVKQAKTDGQSVVDGMKGYLQQWTAEVEEGALTREDLEYLVKEEAALCELTSLKEAGLAAVHLDAFKLGVTNVITSTIASVIKV